MRWPRLLDSGPQLEPQMGRAGQAGAVRGKALSALGVGPPRGPMLPDRHPGSFQTDSRRKGRLLRWGCVYCCVCAAFNSTEERFPKTGPPL